MNINYTPLAVIWALLAVVVLALIAYRKVVSSKEDETLHVGGAGVASQQTEIAHKLDVIDKWGKLLTIIVVVYGLLLGGLYTYHIFLSASTSVGL